MKQFLITRIVVIPLLLVTLINLPLNAMENCSPETLALARSNATFDSNATTLSSIVDFLAPSIKNLPGGKNAFDTFKAHELLVKLPAADAKITRGHLVQLLRNLTFQPTFADLIALLERLDKTMPELAKFDVLADVADDHDNASAVYYALAQGYVTPNADGTFQLDTVAGPETVSAVLNLLVQHPTLPNDQVIPLLKKLLAENSSALARCAALCVYKTATNALAANDVPADLKQPIRHILDEIKNAKRPQGEPTIVAGNSPKTWIKSYPGAPFVREYTIESAKPNTDPVEIVQLTDTHYNLVNDRDFEDHHPAVMSTLEYRLWLRHGSSVPTIAKGLQYAYGSDQTVVTGDILDYLSWGCLELTARELFRHDTALLGCLGGHDVVRKMQGLIHDTDPLEERREILVRAWPHDISYKSRVLKDKVMVVLLDNGASKYRPDQVPQLERDIKLARENNWIILIFQHEAITTGRKEDQQILPIRRNDSRINDFYSKGIGRAGTDDVSMAVYNLIRTNGDVVRGIFCGHYHSDYYIEIPATYTGPDGQTVQTTIPQVISTATAYETGHVVVINVK